MEKFEGLHIPHEIRKRMKRLREQELRSELSYGFDLDYSTHPRTLVKSRWGNHYHIGLYGRLGVHCHNLQNGTNFKYVRWEKFSTHQLISETNYYFTMEAMDPAINSVFSFQTLLSDVGREPGIYITWRTLACRIKCNEPVDDDWGHTAIDAFYQGEMPKWFSADDLASDPKRFYEVQESDLRENDWLQLFSEIAFFTEAKLELVAPPLLEIKKVVIETKEGYTSEAREILKAENAIFYISYKCTGGDCSARGVAGDHKAIVRKTMDGKPGHICIEVAGETEKYIPIELFWSNYYETLFQNSRFGRS
ncbi:unnamed protein product [Arabidopsis halleri]